MQLESTANYSEYYYSLDDTAKQRYKVKLELVADLAKTPASKRVKGFSGEVMETSSAAGLPKNQLDSHVVRGDRCLKDYGFRLSQARRFYSNWSKTKTTTAPTSPSLEGVFMKLFRLLEDTSHQFDLQLAYTYQEESSSSSSFTKYTEVLFRGAVTYIVVAYGEDSPVTEILIRHALDRTQSVEKMDMEIAKTTKVTSKEFALHDGPFVKGLDEALQSFKVQRQQYFGGVFVVTTSTRHCRCAFGLPFCWSNDCDQALSVCECVASDCPSVGAMTVTKPTLCANVRVIRLEVCLVSMVSEYYLDVRVALDCPSVGAMTVTKPTLCVNVKVIRYESQPLAPSSLRMSVTDRRITVALKSAALFFSFPKQMLMQVSQIAFTDAGRIDGNSSNRLRLQSFWSGLRSSNEENKAKALARYKADPEKKKASVRDSYNADIESKQSAKRQRYHLDLDENRAAKRQRYQEDVEDNRAAKRQKYEDNSAAIKTSERNRYWNDPAVRLAKRAAERKRYRRGHRTTTTTQRCSAAPLPSAASSSSAAPTATSSRAALTATSSRAALTATSSRAALTATSSRAALTANSSSRSSRSTATVLVPVPPPSLPWREPGCRGQRRGLGRGRRQARGTVH
eukprot:Em0005g36a